MVKRLKEKNHQHWLYVGPAMIIMVVLAIVPTIFLFLISLTDYQLGWDFSRMKFVGVQNFVRLLSGADRDFWHSLLISIGFMLLATLIEFIIGFIIGLCLNSIEFKLKPLIIAMLIIPLVITPTIAAQMWKLMLNAEYGIINTILDSLFGVRVTWLGDKMAFWSILIVDIWQYTPFVALIIYAGLRSVPADPYESAVIDGASRFQILIHITLPMIRKLVLLTILFRVIDSLRLFDTAFSLTQGGPGTATEFLSLHVYRLANAQNGLIGRAAAVALILLVLTTVISRILIKQMRKEELSS